MVLALFVALMLSLTSATAQAADDIILRTSVTPSEAWIGQRTVLDIEVLGADGWAQIPKLPEPELSGAYVMRTESQGVRLNETIRGTSYTGQRYRLSVYCQRPGRLEIPGMPVTVSVKRWGFPPKEDLHDRQTPATVLVCKVPPGAENVRGLISTDHLDADQRWSSRAGTVALGDAVTRTVSLNAVDVSAMAFPPLQHPEIDGVGIYPGQAGVSDTGDRGTLRGERIETVTYVFEKPGVIELPTIVLPWWDIDDRVLRRIELPGLELEVEGELPPEPVVEAVAEPDEPSRDRVVLSVAIVVVLALGFWLSRRLNDRLIRWWSERRESEPVVFSGVLAAIRGRDAAAITSAVMRWLDRLDPGTRPARLDLFLREHGDGEARAAAATLARCLVTGDDFVEARPLGRGLKAARRHLMRSRRNQRKTAGILPELNG
jgi:hypothetical protein